MRERGKILIFDFDGTIVDTKLLYYKSIYGELKLLGYSYEDMDRIIDMGMNLKETLGKLGLNFISTWFLKRSIMRGVKKHVNEIKKCKDVDAIKGLKEDKILVTNSLKEFAIPVLKHLKIKKYFKEVYGAEDFSDKEEFIRNYIKKNKLDKHNCYYIGDRVADAKLAKKVGCMGVIVSGPSSWNSRKDIAKASPDFIISDLIELKKIVE